MISKDRKITHIIFDVDGTLYDKKREYIKGRGSIEDSHKFFRYTTFFKALNQGKIKDQNNLIIEVNEEYQKNIKQGTLVETIEKISNEIKERYKELVKQYGSNGKVFINEFGFDSKFFAKVIENINFKDILIEDLPLKEMIGELKRRGYSLGILTTETYQTIKIVLNTLGVSIDNFVLKTKTEYPILCSENVSDKKPSHEGFIKLIEITKAESEQILYIGDDFKKDVEAPLKCGLQAVQVMYNGLGNITYEDHQIDCQLKHFVRIDRVYQLTDINELR